MAPKLKPETLEERKTQILVAALTCFSRKGYHQTTMDDIVEEAGLSKGGVYWHFSSKKDLFLALFESLVIDAMETFMADVVSQPGSATEKLSACLRVYTTVATADQFKDIMPLMIDVWAQNWQDPEINEVAVDMYKRFRRPLVELIEEGIASGEFKAVNATALATILFALYDGLAVQWMIDRTMVDWETVTETVKKTFLAGLLAQDAA
jgi:AcrR family transcriptional regulator